jgi:hypothetical protein
MKQRKHQAKYIGKSIYQGEFIFTSIFLLVLTGFFLWAFVSYLLVATEPDPSADSITYETCTFEKCERKKTSQHAYVYHIYVEEYDAPLKIGSIMDGKFNHNALDRLASGDEIVISVSEDRYLYSLSCGSISIFDYEDYVATHRGNQTLGIALMAGFSVIMLGLFIANIVCYKTKGIPLRWGKSAIR